MSRNDKLNQFDDLIDELQRTDKRPSAPRAFKQELRGNLLNQYDQPRLAWGNLRQWVGTAVALGVLGFIVVYAWSIISQPPSVGDPVSVTRPAISEKATPGASPTSSVPDFRVIAQLPAELGDGFRLLDFSISPHVFVAGQPVQVNLSWETIASPSADYTAFLHLVDQSGNLLAQTDQSLGASSTFVNGTRPNTNLTLWLPDNLPSGTFSIVVGLYDGSTGQQLPADRPGLYLAQIEVVADTAVATPTQHAANDVWLIAATQHARTSADDPITLDFTVGYQFESDEEILLQPIYASTDWESHSTGPHTIRNLGNPIPLTKQTGTQTITFTESPEIMRQDVEADIDQLVLVMQLYTRAGTDENGNKIPNILTMLTMSSFVIDLTSTEEITFNADGETAVVTPTQHDTNDVWLISATQHARSSADATVTLEITVGYQFESDEVVMLKPLYANPNWESASGGRSPIDGLSEAITLTEKSGTQTITFSANPDEMRQIVGTDQPVLVMQLGYLSEDENGRHELNILAMPTLTDFAIDLTRNEEINSQMDGPIPSEDRLWIANATQLPRTDPDEAITLEVTIGYKLASAEKAVLSLSFIHPEWGISLDGVRYPNFNALGDEYAVQAGIGSVTITATIEPEQITSAINSDEFRLMTRLWATNENGRLIFDPILVGFNQAISFNAQSLEEITYDISDISQFPECPLDLTRNEDSICTP